VDAGSRHRDRQLRAKYAGSVFVASVVRCHVISPSRSHQSMIEFCSAPPLALTIGR
jgi:hypothetical protein